MKPTRIWLGSLSLGFGGLGILFGGGRSEQPDHEPAHQEDSLVGGHQHDGPR